MDQEQIYDFLDNSVQEDRCGQFRLSQPLPYGVDFLRLAAFYNVQGRTRYDQENYDEALLWYTRILKLLGTYLMTQDERMMVNPSRAEIVGFLSEAYYNRANTHDELGNYAEAIGDYNCSLNLNNSQPWNVFLNRALVKEKMGRLSEAKRDLLDACGRAPTIIRGIENALARIQGQDKKRGFFSRFFK